MNSPVNPVNNAAAFDTLVKESGLPMGALLHHLGATAAAGGRKPAPPPGPTDDEKSQARLALLRG